MSTDPWSEPAYKLNETKLDTAEIQVHAGLSTNPALLMPIQNDQYEDQLNLITPLYFENKENSLKILKIPWLFFAFSIFPKLFEMLN